MTGGVPAISQGGTSVGMSQVHLPSLMAAAGERAGTRFLEFFASTIRNPHTRRAYACAMTDFLAWCENHTVPSITAVQPLHVAAWIEGRTRERSTPTVKQQLAAIRHLFDWLVMGQVVPLNPAASVRGPARSVRRQDAGAGSDDTAAPPRLTHPGATPCPRQRPSIPRRPASATICCIPKRR